MVRARERSNCFWGILLWFVPFEHFALVGAVGAFRFGWYRRRIVLWLVPFGHFAFVGAVGAFCFGCYCLHILLWLVLLGHSCFGVG